MSLHFLIPGSRDGFIRLWKVSSSYRQMEEVNRIPVKGFVNAIAFSNDGARLVAAVGQGRDSIGFLDRSKEASMKHVSTEGVGEWSNFANKQSP